jgi:hypothetical protein
LLPDTVDEKRMLDLSEFQLLSTEEKNQEIFCHVAAILPLAHHFARVSFAQRRRTDCRWKGKYRLHRTVPFA